MASTPSPAYDLRVTMLHIQPEIWRLIRVPADIRMDRLYEVLQIAVGWTDSHLHQFHVFDSNGRTKAFVKIPDPDFEGRTPTQDETKRLLKNFLAIRVTGSGTNTTSATVGSTRSSSWRSMRSPAGLPPRSASTAPGPFHPRIVAVFPVSRVSSRLAPIQRKQLRTSANGWATTTLLRST